MGTFEKLGILVIVVIIVMILAVAIYQWGGAGSPASGTVIELPSSGQLTMKTISQLMEEDKNAAPKPPDDSSDAATWPGGIPKRPAHKGHLLLLIWVHQVEVVHA